MRNLEFIVIHYTATYIHQKIDMDWIKKVHIKRGGRVQGITTASIVTVRSR